MDYVTFGEPSYALTKNLGSIGFKQARSKVEEALKSEGFGVLTEIDVTTTLKNKIDVDFQPYLILGACNPTLAHQAIQAEPGIGALLPCNVVLCGNQDGTVTVSTIDPDKMFTVIENPKISAVAKDVREKLERVMAQL